MVTERELAVQRIRVLLLQRFNVDGAAQNAHRRSRFQTADF